MSPAAVSSDLFHHFRVELDAGEKPLFRGGERITGNVKIQLKREVVIQVIRIQFKGRALQKDSKKGRDVEKVFFDKDYILLERPPGKPEPGNFAWKADFEYSLPFQYILPLGCPSSFESPDGFVRYFARVTFQTSESNLPIYVAKKHFSVYDLDTVPAIGPQFQQPYTYRHTFTSGGCCCRRHVYMEFLMPKRVYYAGENIEARMIIDNMNDERIANNIEYNIVERTTKPDVDEEEALKHPARVIRTGKIDGTEVEKQRNQIRIGSLVIPSAVPASLANAVALAALPRDKTSPQLSPEDNASKLFEHPSILSQPSKEPIFRVHYALQIIIGKFLVEVPFVVRPVESEDVRNTIKQHTSDVVQLVEAQVPERRLSAKEKTSDHFVEPDEHDKIIVGEESSNFIPLVPIYSTRPVDDHEYSWPQLGTFDSKNKLIWHPDKKLTKHEKTDQKHRVKEAKHELKHAKAEERKEHKKTKAQQKKSEKELLIVTGEPANDEANSLNVNVESVPVENRLTPVQSEIVETRLETTVSEQPQSSVAEAPVVVAGSEEEAPKEAKPDKKQLREQQRLEKLEQKRAKEQEKLAKAQAKEAEKREREQAKISEKEARKQQKEDQKRRKKEEAEHHKELKKQAKLNKKHKKNTEEQLLVEEVAAPTEEVVPGPSTETRFVEEVTETIVEQHGNAPPTITTTHTVTEQQGDAEPVTTVEVTSNELPSVPQEPAHQPIQAPNNQTPDPQPISEEIVVVSHLDQNNIVQSNGNGHPPTHENGTNGHRLNGELELNGHNNQVGAEEEQDHVASLKASAAEANHDQVVAPSSDH